MSDQTKLKQKLQFGVLGLLIISAISGCGGGGSSAPGNDMVHEDVAVTLKKSVGPRKEVCWKGRSRLKEIEIQRLGKVRRKKLECNLIKRRALATKKEILALR